MEPIREDLRPAPKTVSQLIEDSLQRRYPNEPQEELDQFADKIWKAEDKVRLAQNGLKLAFGDRGGISATAAALTKVAGQTDQSIQVGIRFSMEAEKKAREVMEAEVASTDDPVLAKLLEGAHKGFLTHNPAEAKKVEESWGGDIAQGFTDINQIVQDTRAACEILTAALNLHAPRASSGEASYSYFVVDQSRSAYEEGK